MLTESAINAVYGTAEELATRGVRLVPKSATPLSELTAESLKLAISSALVSGDAETTPAFSSLLTAGTSGTDAVGHNTHDEIMANAVAAVGQAFNYNAQLAKNVVNPAVERVANRLSSAMEQSAGNAGAPVQVVSLFDRPFWSLPYVTELFGRYQETTPDNVAYTGPAIPYNPEFLETRLESFDVAIREYVAALTAGDNLGSQSAEHYWNASFGRGAFNVNDVISGASRASIDAAIVVYLGAQYLSGNPPENCAMSLQAWETMCRLVMAQAGRAVMAGLRRIERDRRTGTLVLQYPQAMSSGERILVDGPTYNQFLQEGGSPESLLGAMVGERQTNAGELLAQNEASVGRWKTTQATLVSQAMAGRLQVLIRSLELAITDEINGLADDAAAVSKDAYHARLREYLQRIHSSDLDNLWGVARRALCYVLYPHTDAEAMLASIDDQMRANPELGAREAALFSMIDMLGVWLSKLIDVEVVRV